MIQKFKPVTLEAKDEIVPYLEKNSYGICDFSFSNIFSWQPVFNTEYAVISGYLVLRAHSLHSGHIRFLMPVSGEKENLRSVIEELLDLAKDSLFEIVSASEEFVADLETLFPGKFLTLDNRDYYDYVYLSEDLISLKGKKLHGKRNHINRFRELYQNFEYVKITPEMIPECMEMHDKWCMKNGCGEIESLRNEMLAVRRALENFDRLPLKGGAIRVNSEMVAFSLGQIITSDTFDVMVEKAFTEIQGAYTVINQMFIENEAAKYTYINREEDLGVEGLRRAKLSYNPVKLLPKYVIRLK